MIGKTADITNKTPRKFQLRTALVIPFVLQIVVAVGLVGFLSYRNEQQTIEELANRLMNEAGNRVSLYLEDYLKIPPLINRLNAKAMRSGDFDVNSQLQSGRYLLQQSKLFPMISGIQRVNAEGNYVTAAEFGESYNVKFKPSFWGLLVVDGNDKSAYRLYKADEEGNPTQLVTTFTNLPPKERLFYTTAVAAKKAVWIPPYKSTIANDLLIAAMLPVYDPSTGELQAIFGSLISLRFSQFLESLKISPRANIYIVEPNGSLVTNSTREAIFKDGNSDKNEKVQRLTIFDTPSPVLRAAGDYLRQQVGDLSKLQGSKQLKFKVQGESYFLTVIPFQDELGLQLTTIIIIPESDFLAQIHQNARTTALLCLLALLVAIAIGIYTSRRVTRPILRVSQASNELAQGNLDQQVEASPIIEIDKLADSFNGMAGQLKHSFASLETKNEELRLAEENYRSIFENALEGIFQTSPEGRYINVNPAFAKIYGYDSPTEMIETITNIGEQIYVDSQTRHEFREILETQGTVKEFEYRSYRKDKKIIWAQLDARAVKDNGGNVLYYEGLVQDITERKGREDELRRQLEELKIEIDHTKRAKEVAMLTESSFFQEVQQEMAEVNLDEFWS